MLTHCADIKLFVAVTLTSATLFAGSIFGQAPAPQPDSVQKEVEALKAENAAVRELLRNLEEQQKALLEHVDRLQKKLDGTPGTDQPQLADASVPSTSETTAPVTTGSDKASAQPVSTTE